MASEKNNDSFEVFGIIVNKHEYNTEHLQDQYETLITNYIRNSHSTMTKIIENYRSQTNSSLFTVIKFFQEEIDNQQYWINLNIIKFNGKLFGFIMNPGEGSVSENEKIAKLKNIIITEMIPENIEFIDYNNQDESYIRLKNIETALSNIEIFITFLRNEREEIRKNFQELKFFQKNNQSIKFEKLIVEIGLNMKINSKSTLKRILSVLKSLLDTDSEYQLSKENQLKILNSTLISPNFATRGNQQDDLIKDVISLLILLKNREQRFFNEEIKENVKVYFEKNRNKYQKQIDEFNEKLQDNSRDKTIQGRLDLFLKYRMEYLVNVNKLNSDLKPLKEIDEFMKFFYNKNKQKELEIRKNQSENESEKTPVGDISIEIKDELSHIRKELDYYARISEIFNELNFDDFIILLGANNSTEFSLSQEAINIILEIGLITENNQVASAIVKILNFNKVLLFNCGQKIREVLDNVLPKISFEDTDIVLELSKELKIINNSSVLKFLYKVLIENENSKQREEVFKELFKIDCENLKYINETIQLEKKCREKSSNIVKDCLEHVRKGNQITMNCFEKLKDYFDSKEISEIIKIILEQDLQNLPKFFIEKFRQYMQLSSSSQINIISVSKLLIKYKQINFDDIKNIEKFIDNHKTFSNDIFEILRYEYENGREFSKDILDRIRNAAKTNVYARNLIKLIEKTPSNIDLLENTRNSIEIRKNALQNLLQDKQNHTLETFKFLELLIKYDSNLSIATFKILITIMPNNYQLNLIEIGKFLQDDQNLSIDDLTRLIEKDRINGTFIGILPVLINRIEDPQISIDDNNRLMELLSRISSVKQNEIFIIDQLQYFIDIIFNTTNYELRENIHQIIKHSINETTQKEIQFLKHQADGTIIKSYLIDELKKLDSLQIVEINLKSLTVLKENIQQGFIISGDTINLLIDSLNKNEQNLRLILTEILFEINHRQGLNIKHISRIIQNSELLTFTNIIGIIADKLSRNIELPKEIIDNLWKQLLSNNDPILNNYFICITSTIVNQKKSLSIDVMNKIATFLTDENQSMETKIVCSQILLKNFKQNFNYSDTCQKTITAIMDSLRNFALQPRKNSSDDLFNKLCFEILEKSIRENQYDHQFLQNYYNQFKIRLTNINDLQVVNKKKFLEELKPLDELISSNYLNATNCSNLKKFQLLCALNNTLINYKKIDTNIFKEFSSNEWEKEILCNELLIGTFQIINPNDGINEFELEKFRNYIRLINDYLCTLKTNIYSIENLLKILIDKQYIYRIDLKMINDVLLMLYQSNNIETLNLVQDDQDYRISFIQLRQLWLKERLKHFDITFTNEDIEELNEYLPYRSEIINFVLTQIDENTNIKEMILFFNQLFNCDLTEESCEYFLSNEVNENISMNNLRYKLDNQLVCILLTNKYLDYAQYFHDRKNYNLTSKTSSFEENAYNQANTTYWYQAEDIAQISSEWMKEYSQKQFRITQALGQQNDRELSSILIDVLKEYKQDHKLTIIPLNIAGNHWVTLALVYRETDQQHIVLYKDSFGENNLINQREIVRNIFLNELKNIQFKYHRSCEQTDGYNCGVFTLANMKIVAENLSSRNCQSFIDNFEKTKFITQEQVNELRREQFPKLYALSLLQSIKRQKIVNYHSNELKLLQNLLETKYPLITTDETSRLENGLRLSICLPKEENLLKKSDYEYLYVIEASSTILNQFGDFSHESRLKTDIKNLLKIDEIYSIEKNIIKISDKKLSINKQEKIDPNKVIENLSDNDIEIILNQLSIERNQSNKQILCMNLGLTSNQSYKTDQIININNYELIKKLHKKLTKVLHSGWLLNSIEQIIDRINTKQEIENFFSALDPIYEYNLKEFHKNIEGKCLIDILTTSSSSKNLIKDIHDLALYQTFQGTYDKNFQQLKDDILNLNMNQNISILQNNKLTEEYEKIKIAYANKSKLCPEFDLIKKWSISNIKEWSRNVKTSPSNNVTLYEKIAVVKKAVELTSKFPPREIQLLSILVLMNPEKDTGRLAQINTGEGKTTIVAMLAALKALEGHRVDVITSSPELAKPQSIQQKKFYHLFNLTVSHNGTDSIDIKERYNADIVYGAAGDFQGDILRDEYSKLGTRNGRKCDIAIVDEVDSMLIDGKNHIVMLSSPMPAMDHLEPLLAAIWIQIEQIAKCIQEINGKDYYIEQPDIFNDNGTVKPNILETAYPIETSKEEFIKRSTENHIRKLIRDIEHLPNDTDKEILKKYPEIKIPKHLRQLVIESQLIKWIDSAIYAKYRCQNNQHYVLRNGKIAPVDASNTGIVQQNMNWNDGLHQFLQIKHGAKITAESLTTNFLSNVTYFRRYGSNIYGLTGTLGSENAQKLLSKIYNVDNIIVPPFRKKQYQELTPIIVKNENDWYENIIESSMSKLNNRRGVLIITKYIKEVDEIKNRLNKIGYDQSKIKTYRTENESNSIEEEMKPGEIIIATNIAGRGTDIRANRIEQNGGLHVLVTFLPSNERVEQQNIGRTSRTGNKGTGQFILLEKHEDNYEKLKVVRNIKEDISIHTAETEIEKVTIKDAIFEKFCKLLTIIAGNHMTTDIATKIKARAVEDRFGIWLKLNEKTITTTTTSEEMLQKFDLFQQEILNDKENDTLIKNPYFYILIGNEYLNDKHNVKNQDAIIQFTKAIELDEPFQANAYYNRGYARIALYGKDSQKYKQEIDKAIDDFKQAKRIIEDNFEPMLHIIQQASNSEALSEQVTHKMTLFSVQKNTIELAIGTENSIDIEIQALEKQKQQKNLKPEDITKIQEQINNLRANKQLREVGIIGQARGKERNIEIEHLEIEKALPEDQDIKLYTDEINEYENNGFRGCFKIKEIKPIDWWAVISVAALGISQLVGGAALAVFSLGAGASVGMGLIFEGVSDLITAVKDGIISRDFSWVSYGIQKAISLTVSLVCAGLGAIKDAAKTVVAGVKSFGQGLTTTTVKAGWKIAAKAIGTGLAKGVAKELVKQLVDYGANKTLMPSITEEIMKRVEEPIQSALLTNDRVKTMLELDGKNRNSKYESLIKSKAMELLNSREHQSALKTITVGIAKGIATQKIPGFSALLTTYEMTTALEELARFVPNFIRKLNEEIEKIYKEQKIEEIISQNENKPDEQQQHEVNKRATIDSKQETKKNEKQENHQTYASNFIADRSDGDIDLKNVQEEEQIKLNSENKSPDSLCRILATNVSANMCNIIQHKLIAPITNAGINLGMTKVTAELDRNLQEQIGNYQSERRIEVSQDVDQHDRLPGDYKQGSKNAEALAKAGEMIQDMKNGGEAGLPHLGSLSDAVGRPIKVYDENGELIRIIGEKKGGYPVEIQYHKPNKDNPSGHWTLPGGKEPVVNNSGKNNCLFNVVAEQTKKDPNQLRADTATRMENNKVILANQAFDIIRLEQYKQNALTMGGIRLSGSNIYFNDEEIDMLIQSAQSGFNKREEPPKDLDIISAQDDKGNIIPTSKHHLIPENEIRKDFEELVKTHRNDRNRLKTELNKYINHGNNAIAKERFISAFNLKENSEVTDRPEVVVREIQTAVSWHANNYRIGPEGTLRTDDPEKRKTSYRIDFPVSDAKTTACLNRYVEEKKRGDQVNILSVLNKLPNDVDNYAWEKLRHGKYQVDRTKTIGKTSRFYKSKRAENATFNPCRSKREQNLHP